VSVQASFCIQAGKSRVLCIKFSLLQAATEVPSSIRHEGQITYHNASPVLVCLCCRGPGDLQTVGWLCPGWRTRWWRTCPRKQRYANVDSNVATRVCSPVGRVCPVFRYQCSDAKRVHNSANGPHCKNDHRAAGAYTGSLTAASGESF
jgi:hypothetical protein